MGYPSASLTSRSAPARYAQEGSCPSYALSGIVAIDGDEHPRACLLRTAVPGRERVGPGTRKQRKGEPALIIHRDVGTVDALSWLSLSWSAEVACAM
jgi:hypothetical protein